MTNINLDRYAEDAVDFPAGQIIFKKGQTASVMYGVMAGSVDLFLDDELLETVGEGGIFGELALIVDEPRSATAVARTDCKLVGINRDIFMKMVQHSPEFALQVIQIMAERLRRETGGGW